MVGNDRYLLFKGCTYRKYNKIDLKGIPLPPGSEWVEIEEYCCGSNFFLMGNLEMADGLKNINLKKIQENEIDTIVTPCPHCYMHFKNVYHKYLGGAKILHTAQLLDTVPYQEIPSSPGTGEIVTYHDPCILGRFDGIYEEPRNILYRIFQESQVKEMKENRENSPCCGSGWLVNSRRFINLAQEIAKNRLEAAEQTGARTLITACPSCQKLFNSIAKEKHSGLTVRDINGVFLEKDNGVY